MPTLNKLPEKSRAVPAFSVAWLFIGLLLLAVLPVSLAWAQNSQISGELLVMQRKAEEFEAKDQFYNAIEVWQRILRGNPNSSKAYFRIARSYMHLESYKEALGFVDKAILLANQDFEAVVLKSRILMGLKRYDEAGELLLQLREHYTSHHIDLALAELFAVLGDMASSIEYLNNIKEFSDNNLNFLLTSLMVYEEAGQREAADRYLRQALDSHYNAASVHKVAARYYLGQGRYSEVMEEIDIIKRLGIDTEELRLLALEAAYLKGDYQLATNLARTLLRLYPRSSQAWHLLGMAYSSTDQLDEALRALDTARRIDPEDELNQIVSAEILRGRYSYPSRWHRDEAARYIASARAKHDNLLYDEALQNYRFALQIDPLNKQNWLAFANVFRDRGNYAKYLDKLYAWLQFGVLPAPKNGINRATEAADSGSRQLAAVQPTIEHLIDIYKASQNQSVAQKWGLEQYKQSNFYYPTQVFVLKSKSLDYIGAVKELGSYFVNILQWYEQPAIIGDIRVVEDRLQAQQIAHTAKNSDYYIILDFTGQGENFRAETNLYLSATGHQVAGFSAERVSRDKIYHAFSYLARQLHSLLPKKGRILQARPNRVVISQGGLDGVEEGQEWLILPETTLSVDKPFAEYEDSQIIGTLRIEAVDEKVSEGQVKLRSIVRPAKIGYLALLPLAEAGESEQTQSGGASKDSLSVLSKQDSADGGVLRKTFSYGKALWMKLFGNDAAEGETGASSQPGLPLNQELLREPNLDLQSRFFELS